MMQTLFNARALTTTTTTTIHSCATCAALTPQSMSPPSHKQRV